MPDSPTLGALPLFFGIQEADLPPMLHCLGSFTRSYAKGAFLSFAAEELTCVGVVLQGAVHMIKEDIGGNKTVLAVIKQGELFGETFVCGDHKTVELTFFAATACRVLFLPFHKVLRSCRMTCVHHHRLIENMVGLIAAKNVMLIEKIEIISQKSLRDKILTYLSLQARRAQSSYFDIPLSRLALAEYLCADRSALSRELSRMQEEGLLDFDKNSFHLRTGRSLTRREMP